MASNSKAVMEAQRRKKMTAVAHFGGKCLECGYFKCLGAMEFHHVEKDEKEESPSYIIMRWSWDRVLKELEKCILLCCRCHREVHYDPSRNVELKRQVKPWLKLICEQCKGEFSTKCYDQKFCSESCKHLSDRKVTRPSAHELKNLLEQGIPWLQLGKKFGVSDNAVRKWARSYDLLT
jgi:hypothetical protein